MLGVLAKGQLGGVCFWQLLYTRLTWHHLLSPRARVARGGVWLLAGSCVITGALVDCVLALRVCGAWHKCARCDWPVLHLVLGVALLPNTAVEQAEASTCILTYGCLVLLRLGCWLLPMFVIVILEGQLFCWECCKAVTARQTERPQRLAGPGSLKSGYWVVVLVSMYCSGD